MTDLQMIEKIERHIGFVINRLTCDGNIYAQKIKLKQAYVALDKLGEGCLLLRHALVGMEDCAEPAKVQEMLNSFNDEMYEHEIDGWE